MDPWYGEALHQTHQQVETESGPQTRGFRTVVSQCPDQQQAFVHVALASTPLVDQVGHRRFHHSYYMGSLNTVHDCNPERQHSRRHRISP